MGPLMPEHLQKELNPMTITVVEARGIPPSPTPFQELKDRSVPACLLLIE